MNFIIRVLNTPEYIFRGLSFLSSATLIVVIILGEFFNIGTKNLPTTVWALVFMIGASSLFAIITKRNK
jgi:hypothetical protein